MIDITSIKQMRDSGYSWELIGNQYGLTAEAIRARYKRLCKKAKSATPTPIVDGVMPDTSNVDIKELWDRVLREQEKVERLELMRQAQSITVKAPCGITLLNDLHIGNAGTNYKAIRRDAQIIRDTPDLWAAMTGDGVDNWIIGKLQALQRNQVVNYDSEWLLFFDWLDMLRDKFIFIVSGNHENWTYKIANVDRVKDHMKGVPVLYDRDEVIFSLFVGKKEWKVKARHKWRGNSVFNPTHGIEVSWERTGFDFDIGIGAHTHIGTVCRPFLRHGRRMYAILVSTYKTHDTFGRAIGFSSPYNLGSGVMVFDQNGSMTFFEDIKRGAEYLTMLKSKRNHVRGR